MKHDDDLEAAGLERIMQGREARARLAGERAGVIRGLRMALELNQDVRSPGELGTLVANELRKQEREDQRLTAVEAVDPVTGERWTP